MEPVLLKNVLPEADFQRLSSYCRNIDKTNIEPDQFGRRLFSDKDHLILKEYSQMFLPIAREHFNDSSIVPSFSLLSEYSENEISLFHHKDKNACTFNVDLVLYQDEPWGIWVEGREYILYPNEALLFLGEEQEHWREPISNNTNKIALAFFHYIKPNHWWLGNPNWTIPK